MSRSDDYKDDVSNTKFVDQDVERLFSGLPPRDPGLAELAPFMEALRSQRSVVPSAETEEHLAARAAALVRSSQTGPNGVVPLSPGDRPDRRPSWLPARAAFAMAGFALVIVAFGLGWAAHVSVPGDPLYGLDRTLEAVGIGDGSLDERFAEADNLIAAGDNDAALGLLGATLEQTANAGDTAGADEILQYIEVAATGDEADAEIAERKVQSIRAFIDENRELGVGLDGDEFSRGIAEIVRSEP